MASVKDIYKSSFGILRSNPKITGNVKITIDSSNDLWLNAIESNDELTKNQYKGYKILSNSNYAYDCYNFFNQGKTPTSIIFGLKNQNSQNKTYTQNLEDQYDGFYQTGVSGLASSVYTEDFSYFSPFWMGENIPKYFIIFRVDDPIDFSYQIPVTTLEIGKTYKVLDSYGLDTASSSYKPFTISSDSITYTAGSLFVATSTQFSNVDGTGSVILFDPNYNIESVNDVQSHLTNYILPKSKIVKTFSLGSDSKLGSYLRKIQNDPNYTQNLIDIKFEENSISTYNGVSVKDGIFAKKGEYLNKIFSQDSNIIDFEDYITKGFERNGIISTSLLNLEFLFNDSDANLYTINRYFGLYVDDIPTGTFKLSGASFYKKSVSAGNFPEPKNSLQISDRMTIPFNQTNNNGIRLFIDPSSKWGYIPSSDDININERLKFFYVKDKNNNFYTYNQTLNYDSENSPNNYIWGDNTENPDTIILSNKSLDISVFSGIDPLQTKEYFGSLTGVAGKSYSVIQILNQLNPGNTIVIYHPFGRYFSSDNKRYDYFVASDLEYIIGGWGPGSYMTDSGAYYFHPFGTTNQVASAIAGCLNSLDYKSYKAFEIDNEIVIRTNGANYNNDRLYGILVYSDFYSHVIFNTPNTVVVNDVDSIYLQVPLEFIGGSKYTNTRIKVKVEDSKKITPGVSCVRTTNGLSVIKSINKCIDETDYELTYGVIKDYRTHAIIEMSDNSQQLAFSSIGTFIVEEIISVETGVLSLYGLKDFDFDFWSSDYGKIITDEYYRYIDIQPDGITPIYPGIDYAVAQGAIVFYNENYYGDTYLDSDGNNLSNGYIFRGAMTLTSYTLIQSSTSQKINVIPTLYVKSLESALVGINDPQADLDKFPGFTGLQDIKFLNDLTSINNKYDELNFGKATNEYDILKENYQRSLVVNSRVTPYITKWVYEGGIDVKGNGYRLNSSHTFTPLNFSPSFFSPGVDPLYFSNEWYLLENIPMSSTPNLLENSSNYCVSNLSVTDLQNANPASQDYFLKYFTIEGNDFYNIDNVRYSRIKNKDVEERYTFFNYNSSLGFSETLFRGIKVRIKERTQSSLITKDKNLFKNNDTQFKDYKFSCILKSIEDPDPYTVTSPITYSVYKNDTFKTVTLVITIIIGDSRFIDLSTFANKMVNNTDNIQHSNYLLKTYGYDLSFPSLNLSKNLPKDNNNDNPINNLTTSWFFNPVQISGSLDYFGIYSLSDKLQPGVYNFQNYPDYTVYNNAGGYGIYNGDTEETTILPDGYLFSGIASVKLSSGLNPTLTGSVGILGKVDNFTTLGTGILPISVNPDYDTDLREEIKYYPSSTGTDLYNKTIVPGLVRTYQLYSPSINTDNTPNTISYNYITPFPTGVGKNYINFSEISITNNYVFDYSGYGLLPNTEYNASAPVNIRYKDIYKKSVYQLGAGSKYWEYIFNKITFQEIYKLFLEQNPYINYTSTYWDGTQQKTSNGTYVLEFIKPSSFSQKSRYIPIEEDYKPSFLSSTLSGYKLTKQETFIEFFRYGGGYSPKFKNVLLFDNIKTDKLYGDVDTSFPNEDIDAPYLTINVELVEKVKNESLYYGIGSPYEIVIDGIIRKPLRLVQGSKYKFVFNNFGGTNTTVSPLPDILQNFVISTAKGSGQTKDVYTSGFTYNVAGNYAIFEVPNNSPSELYYELEGEIYSGGYATVTEGLEFKNSTLGVNKKYFGIVKNVNYYKYLKSNVFRIDPSTGYNLEYPLIGETPIDKRDVNIFESTWDAGRYRQYLSNSVYNYLPGTKNMKEQKSFFGSKIMKTPGTFKEAKQIKYSKSISDVFNANLSLYPNYEILWEETSTQIKALLLLDRTSINHFKNGGINVDFNKFLVSEFGVNSETTFDDDISQYISLNILPEYETKQLNVFIKTVHTTTTSSASSAATVSNQPIETIVTNLSDFEKINNGYVKSQNNNVTKRSELVYEFILDKDPALLYSIGFSYMIGKI
jgi:hypothetical protein